MHWKRKIPDRTDRGGSGDIDEHYKNGSLSELAGKTYKELLQEKQMSQARYLLDNPGLPVSDIIESVGYDNTSYFYRRFKEKYGMGPKEYRTKENKDA